MKMTNCVAEGLASDIHVNMDMEIPENSEGQLAKYQISKILAHQESLAFIRDHDVNYSLITFHPSFVLGHSLIQRSVEDIDAMNGLLLQSIQSKTPLMPPIIVDVTDVAEAHLRALDPSLPTGTEFLLTGAPATWHDIVNYVKTHFKQFDIQLASPFPEYPTVDASRATTLLGMKWKPLNETIRSVLSQQLSFKEKK
jgi:nucleoside-diphosphate-sugar epimerase